MFERMRGVSSALTPAALTVLRVVTGFVMAVHGWLKVTEFASWRATVVELGLPAPSLMAALSTVAELGGGILLMLGLFTPLASVLLVVNMIAAILLVHRGQGLLASEGGWEYPLVLATIALFFLVRGAGPVSLDRALFGRHRPEARAPFGREARV